MDWRHTEYPQQLAGKLFLIANDLIDLNMRSSNVNNLLSLHCQVCFPDDSKIISRTLTDWLNELLRDYTAAGRGTTDAVISLDDLSSCYTSFSHVMLPDNVSLERYVNYSRASLSKVVSLVSQYYDFKGLIKELDYLTDKLQTKGLTQSANQVADALKMVLYHSGHEKNRPAMTGAKASFFLTFSKDDYSYSSYFRDKLKKLMDSMRVVEEDAGIDGLHASFIEIYETFYTNNWRIHESRSVINETGLVSCIVFKEKLQFKMSREIAEAIISFVKLYSDKELWFSQAVA